MSEASLALIRDGFDVATKCLAIVATLIGGTSAYFRYVDGRVFQTRLTI